MLQPASHSPPSKVSRDIHTVNRCFLRCALRGFTTGNSDDGKVTSASLHQGYLAFIGPRVRQHGYQVLPRLLSSRGEYHQSHYAALTPFIHSWLNRIISTCLLGLSSMIVENEAFGFRYSLCIDASELGESAGRPIDRSKSCSLS